MKKRLLILSGLALLFALLSFTHKFYVGIYQVHYSESKQRLEITCRIFADDLNAALKKTYKKDFAFGEKTPSADEESQLAKYVSDRFSIKINGTQKKFEYLSCEMESNVLIAYFRIPDVEKISKLDISNRILFDYVTEQQNIIQTNVNSKKQNLLLTNENPSGRLNY